MAIFRACSALALASVAAGQLVYEPPVDVAQLMHELKSEGLFSSQDEQVSTDIVSPTICDSSVKQHAGYVNVGLNTNYFFWLFESRSDPAKDPLVMWLNGGPGCSSLLGLFTENGPCTVDKDGKTTHLNKNSWNSRANVIYVDQPSATGFSTGLPTTHDEQGVASNMYKFMEGFYKALPQYANKDFYLFGESYAGHYVPAISHYFWKQSKSGGFKVPLKGVGIGNGLVDPEEQYKWYPDMAKDGGKSEGGTLENGVITSTLTQAAMRAATYPCVSLIKSCNSGTNSSACSTAYAICNYGELIPYQLTGYNPYDMRIKCAVPPLCYDMSQVDGFLNSADVQKELGTSKKWESCNRIVNMAFQGDWMKTYQQMLPDMLADGIKVLVYAGDVDYICNWLGNKKWTLAMEWPHKDEFNQARDADYNMNGKAVGKLRTSNGFHFMQIFQAGHMVPMDQPEVSLQMLDEFITDHLSTTEAITV